MHLCKKFEIFAIKDVQPKSHEIVVSNRTVAARSTYFENFAHYEMTFDQTYQAVPHNCVLIELAYQKPQIGEFLDLFGFADVSFEDLKFRAGDPDFNLFVENTKEIRRRHPGIEDRRLNLAGRWDALLFTVTELLAASGFGKEQQWIKRAILGGDIIGASICTAQGIPIRFTSAFETKMLAARLGRIHPQDLERFWDIEKMTAEGVVGIEEVVRIKDECPAVGDYERLSELYAAAADNDEGILVLCG